jgi:hypothetical protein
MYSDNIKSGDDLSTAEELLNGVPVIEQKCRAIEKAVKEDYFTLEGALTVYGVSEIEYFSYLMSKYSSQLKKSNKQEQLMEALVGMSIVFLTPNMILDSISVKQIMDRLAQYATNISTDKSILNKMINR